MRICPVSASCFATFLLSPWERNHPRTYYLFLFCMFSPLRKPCFDLAKRFAIHSLSMSCRTFTCYLASAWIFRFGLCVSLHRPYLLTIPSRFRSVRFPISDHQKRGRTSLTDRTAGRSRLRQYVRPRSASPKHCHAQGSLPGGSPLALILLRTLRAASRASLVTPELTNHKCVV
jgi:hypothetical protein